MNKTFRSSKLLRNQSSIYSVILRELPTRCDHAILLPCVFIHYVPFSSFSNCTLFFFCNCVKIIIPYFVAFHATCSYFCPVCRFLFPLGRDYCGYSLPSCLLGPARDFPYNNGGWNQWMASKNRVFSCIIAKFASSGLNCKPTFNSFSGLKITPVLLLRYCYLNFCSSIGTDNSVFAVHSLISQLCFFNLSLCLSIKRRTDLELLSEMVCAEVTVARKKVLFSVVYRSPSQRNINEQYPSFFYTKESNLFRGICHQ